MGEREQESAVSLLIGADHIFQARFAEKGFDGHSSHQQDDLRLHQAYFRLKPGAAEGYFGWRGTAVAIAARVFAGVAVGERGEIAVVVQVAGREACLFQPFLQNAPAGAAEWPILLHGTMARSLSDDHDGVVRAPAHQRVRLGDIAVLLAETTGANALVQAMKSRLSSDRLLLYFPLHDEW